MRITKRQLKRIIREERARLFEQQDEVSINVHAHGQPSYDWGDAALDLAEEWKKREREAFDTGDPSMMGMGETTAEAKEAWEIQVEDAGEDLEAELRYALRKAAVKTMAKITSNLINGEYGF